MFCVGLGLVNSELPVLRGQAWVWRCRQYILCGTYSAMSLTPIALSLTNHTRSPDPRLCGVCVMAVLRTYLW